jgi:Amt family ammonium transporter
MEELMTNLDTLWILMAAVLVFFMQAGFAMVEAGFTRAKNSSNIMMKNLMDFVIGSILFFLIGFGLMFGQSKGFIGTTGFFAPDGISDAAFILFQTVFCATAATIVSGAMAERTKFVTYLIYSAVISLLIYPVSGSWIWNAEGWLAKLGFHDFAGSTVVHSVGGWCALIGAKMLGPRIGKYNPDGTPRAIPGHNIALGTLGVFILWFGWFGFNPGSELTVNSNIGHIAMTTNLAAAAGAMTVLFISWGKYKKPDVSMTLNGALAGLVGITAGCAVVDFYGALAIGVICGFAVFFGIEFVEKKLKIDDPVGAISVHGICGATGTILVGLFATGARDLSRAGLFYGGGFTQLGVQVLGVLSVGAWAVGLATILFLVLKKTVGLRVTEQEEILGLDLGEHNIQAYPDFVIK